MNSNRDLAVGSLCFLVVFACAGLRAAAVDVGVQLLRDPGFEESLPNGTFPSSGYWERDWLNEAGAVCTTTAALTGDVGLWIYTGEDADSWCSGPYQLCDAIPGGVFTGKASCRHRTPWSTGSEAVVQVAFLNASGRVLSSYESTSIEAEDPTWAELTVTTQAAPADVAKVRFRLYLDKPRNALGQSIANFDDAYLELTDVPSTPQVDIYPVCLGLRKSETTAKLEIRNTGPAAIGWTLTPKAWWIDEVSPSEGDLASGHTQTVTITVDRSGLSETLYEGSLEFVAGTVAEQVRVFMDMAQGYDVPSFPSHVNVSRHRLILERRLPDGSLDVPVPYVIKGAAWSPTSRGSGENHAARREEFNCWYVADVQLLVEMSANTVYAFLDFGTEDSGLEVLDNLYKNGIMAIVTVDEDGEYDTDRISRVVAAYKNHPALLMWAIGNEWNINLYHERFSSLTEAAEATERAALQVKQLDDAHPVASIHGEINISGQQPLLPAPGFLSTSEIVNMICPSVDVWGLNIYRGDNFSTLFDEWLSIADKPMFISEFGTDSFFTTNQGTTPVEGEADEEAQAAYTTSLWDDLRESISAYNVENTSLGGTVFEWVDEWWKVPAASGGDPDVQDTGGFPTPWNTYAHPDAFGNEEWFGIVNIARRPKLAYTVLQTSFSEPVNIAPLIYDQEVLYGVGGAPILIDVDDLRISDPDSDYQELVLQVNDGQHYARSRNTITPEDGFVGDLSVPVVVSDGQVDSDVFDLQVTIGGQTGSLNVTIEPLGARNAGAQWRVEGVTWQDSGTPVHGLSAGSHTVSFKDVPGWTTPSDRIAIVAAGEVTEAFGTYEEESPPYCSCVPRGNIRLPFATRGSSADIVLTALACAVLLVAGRRGTSPSKPDPS